MSGLPMSGIFGVRQWIWRFFWDSLKFEDFSDFGIILCFSSLPGFMLFKTTEFWMFILFYNYITNENQKKFALWLLSFCLSTY